MLAAIAPVTGALSKVVTPAAAAEAAERWRTRGYKVGFTDGCSTCCIRAMCICWSNAGRCATG